MKNKKRVWLLAAAVLATASAAHAAQPANASVRRAAYLETHRQLPPAIADGIDRGCLVMGMDPEQAVVVLGQPLSRRDRGGSPPIEIWLYARLHQSGSSHSGATLFRLVFIGRRLALIEPV